MKNKHQLWRENCVGCQKGLNEMRWSPGDDYYFFCLEVGCDLSELLYSIKLTKHDFDRYANEMFRDDVDEC